MPEQPDKYRKLTYRNKVNSITYLQKRIEQPSKCAVVYCNHSTIYASSYCYQHRLNQKRSGSPFACSPDLRLISDNLSPTAKAALTSDPSDLAAFQRACKSVNRYRDSRYQTSKKTLIKFRSHWANAYKAPIALWMGLQKRGPEELLETSFGAALHIYTHRDDLAVTESHLTNLLAKSMAFVVVPTVFKQGEITRAGRLLVDILDESYGPRHWRGCLRDAATQIINRRD